MREVFATIGKDASRLQLMVRKSNFQPTTRNTMLEDSTLVVRKSEAVVFGGPRCKNDEKDKL